MTKTGAASPRENTDGERYSGSQAFGRGLHVLEALAGAETPQSASEVASRTGLSRQAVYRVLYTLEEFGYLRDDVPADRFALNLRLLSLSRGLNASLRRQVSPYVRELAEHVGATTIISILEGDETVCFIAEEPRDAIVSIRYREGMRRPKSLGASGKIMRFLENPDSDVPEIAAVRELGYATSSAELEHNTSAIALPLSDLAPGTKACLTLIFPQVEAPSSERLLRSLRETAAKISGAINHR